MQDISPSLLSFQRASTILGKNLLIRCVLTYGSNSNTYTTTKIKQLTHTRQGFSHKVSLVLDDTDKTLHSLDLEGYKVVLSYGGITKAGSEWMPTAPLWVVGQDRDSYRDRLECGLELEGIFDRMGKHTAEASYTVESGDSRTIKDWLIEIISLTNPDSESTVEQATSDSDMSLREGLRYFAGQRLTITDRTVTKLALKLKKVGTPSGPVKIGFYTVDPDDPLVGGDLLALKEWGDANSLTTSYDWVEVTLATPVYRESGEVRIVAQFQDGDASNYVEVAYNSSSVLASEHLSHIYQGDWTDEGSYDAVYRYTYSATPLTVWNNYPPYGLVFDSEDDLIDSFIPADSFRINLNDNRLQKVKELLRYTDCVARAGSDGLIHIFVPTTSGTTYDYSYSLEQGRDFHNFFSKRFRRRVVSPNYITVKNHPSHDDSYTGFAKDASADLTDMREIRTYYLRATSNAQCTNLATAFLSKAQMAADKGSAVVPFVNFAQEEYDYVNFVDERAGDSRAGNIGFITIFYRQGQFSMHLGFGRVPIGVPSLTGYGPETGSEQRLTPENLLPLIDNAYSWIEQIINILEGKVDIDDLNDILLALYEDAYFRKATISQELLIPSEAA